ncbi:MAG: hypothetical protein LBV21_06940 [Candidatus Adiutrix sp.]|jgi:hypothetical protein|nr:hypothetical protein [Candidatus Adiutrix sp.]
MNTLTVDGNSLTARDVGGTNLEEIITNLMEHPAVVNRVITQVLVNGDNYSEEVPHAALEVMRSQIDRLDLVTHTAEDLCLHFLEHGHYFVETLRLALPKVVEEFRLGDETEANEHFLSFLESLHLTLNMVEQAKISMGLGEDIAVGGLGSLNDYLGRLERTLTSLTALQEQSDWVYLADVLEYELDQSLAELIELLPLLKKAGH